MRDLKPGQKALEYSFKGKKVLVTGGGRGVGRGLVKRLYEDGATVFTIEKDENRVEQLKKDFPKARIELGDISEWDNTQKIIESFGPLDLLINNACVASFSSFMETTEKTFNNHINNNLKGVFCVTQAVAKGMIAAGNGGSIVNIGSLLAIVGSSVACAYSISKAAGDMLTKNLAVELGKHNIRVNGLIIGATHTELLHECGGAELMKTHPDFFVNRQPLVGAPVMEVDEVVDTTLFLLSPLSSITNGHTLVLDGGISVC